MIQVTRREIDRLKRYVEGIRDQTRRQVSDFNTVISRLDEMLEDDDEPTMPQTPEAKNR